MSSERLGAEAAIETALLRGLLERAPDGVLLVDRSGRIALINQQVERLFGYGRGDLLGKAVELLVPEHLRRRHIEHQGAYQQRPGTRPMGSGLELFGRRSDGSVFPVEISLSPFQTDGQAFVIAFVRDITERKEIEAASRRSEDRYRLLAENAQDIIYRIRLSPSPPRIEYVSPAVATLTGYSPEDHYGDPDLLFAVVHPDDRSLLRQWVADPEAVPSPLILRVRRRDGGVAWHEQRFTAVYDDAGRLVAIEGIARDITQRIRAEEARQNLLAETALQRERERIARDLHDGVIGEILGAGLNLITAKRLLAPEPAEPVQLLDESIEELRSAIAHLRDYIMDLRAERPGGDVSELLAGLVRDFEIRSAIPTSLRLPDAVPELREEVRLAVFHVVQESLTNAWKHSRARSVTVAVGQQGGVLNVEVRDDGIGFDANAGRAEGHLGLGNMAARARELGGTLDVHSDPGGGTAVQLRIPLEGTAAA